MTATRVKKKSANIDSNGVEGAGDGIAGVAACDGAARLQAEQCSLTARMSLIIPGQNTIDRARDFMDDTQWNEGFEGPYNGETGVRQHGHGTRLPHLLR